MKKRVKYAEFSPRETLTWNTQPFTTFLLICFLEKNLSSFQILGCLISKSLFIFQLFLKLGNPSIHFMLGLLKFLPGNNTFIHALQVLPTLISCLVPIIFQLVFFLFYIVFAFLGTCTNHTCTVSRHISQKVITIWEVIYDFIQVELLSLILARQAFLL